MKAKHSFHLIWDLFCKYIGNRNVFLEILKKNSSTPLDKYLLDVTTEQVLIMGDNVCKPVCQFFGLAFVCYWVCQFVGWWLCLSAFVCLLVWSYVCQWVCLLVGGYVWQCPVDIKTF